MSNPAFMSLLLALEVAYLTPMGDAASAEEQWETMVTAQKKKFKADTAAAVRQGDFILSGRDEQLTIWAHFENQDGNLRHSHCRVGRAEDPNALFLPLNARYPQNPKESGRKFAFYYCCVPSTTEKIAAAMENECYSVGAGDCYRMPDSKWCGVPSEIITGGCLDDFKLLRGSSSQERESGIPFNNDKTDNGYKIHAFFRCKEKKLTLERCNVGFLTRPVQPGEYLLFEGLYHVCPKAKRLETTDELKNVGKSFVAVAKKDDPHLAGLTQNLPPGFAAKCVEDWAVLTDNGNRYFELDGHVTVVDHKPIEKKLRTKGGHKHEPAIVALFKCDKGPNGNANKLVLVDCVKVEDDNEVPAKDLQPRIAAADCRTLAGVKEGLR